MPAILDFVPIGAGTDFRFRAAFAPWSAGYRKERAGWVRQALSRATAEVSTMKQHLITAGIALLAAAAVVYASNNVAPVKSVIGAK